MARRSPRIRSRWPAMAAGVFLLPLLAGWVVTRGWFLKSVVVPRVGAALHSELSVGEILWSPWSEITLRQIRLTPQDSEPLVTADSVRVRYRLPDLLKGRLVFQEMTVESPVLSVAPNEDGTSNLSRLGSGRRAAAPASSEKPPVFDVRNVAVRNGTVRWRQSRAPGAPSAEVSGLGLGLDVLAPDAPGRLTLASRLALTAGGTNAISGNVSGTWGFRLNDALVLRELNGAATATTESATGRWKEYGKLSAHFSADSTRSEIRELRLALTNAGQGAGEIRLSGPFDPEKQEARIAYRVAGIGPAVLEFAGALLGVDLGGTRLEAEGRVDVLRHGAELSWQGRVAADPLSVRQGTRVTPELSLVAEVRLRADLENRSALLEKADLNVRQAGQPVVTGALNRPMNLAWGADARGTRDAAYTLKVSRLATAPWRSYFGPGFPSGTVGLEATVNAEREGRLLKFQVTGAADQLRWAPGDAVSGGLDLRVDAAGSLEEFTQFHTDHWRATLQRGSEVLATSTGLAQVNIARGESSLQWSADAKLPPLLRSFPLEGVLLTNGSGTLTTRLTIRNAQTNLSVQAQVSGVSGAVQGAALRNAEGRLDLTAALQNRDLEISRLVLALPRTPNAVNELEVKGRLQLGTNSLVSGELLATSPALDLTPVAGYLESRSDAAASAPTRPGDDAGGGRLPVGRLTWESRLDALYLRQMVVSNWIARVEVTADRIRVDPFQLTLNGAPVSAEADLHLEVPGQPMDFKASALGVPVRPLAASILAPDPAGLTGVLDATVDLKGISSQGPVLRSRLAGTASLAATNLNYRVASLKSPLMRVLVKSLAASLRLPSISEAPLRALDLRATAGEGVVTLEAARVASDAFLASTRGPVRLADAWTNSTLELPITVSLPRQGAWDELPTFLTVRGTLGDPRPDLDALGLARVLPRLPGAAGELGVKGIEKVGSALDRVLGGKSGTNATPGAATGLLRNLLGVPPAATNAPKTPPKQP